MGDLINDWVLPEPVLFWLRRGIGGDDDWNDDDGDHSDGDNDCHGNDDDPLNH